MFHLSPYCIFTCLVFFFNSSRRREASEWASGPSRASFFFILKEKKSVAVSTWDLARRRDWEGEHYNEWEEDQDRKEWNLDRESSELANKMGTTETKENETLLLYMGPLHPRRGLKIINLIKTFYATRTCIALLANVSSSASCNDRVTVWYVTYTQRWE